MKLVQYLTCIITLYYDNMRLEILIQGKVWIMNMTERQKCLVLLSKNVFHRCGAGPV